MAIEANVQQGAAVVPAAPQQEGTIKLTVTGIINDLNDGIDRDGIQAKYGLTKAEVTELFKHPKLSGLRARKKIPIRFTLIDDTIITKSESTSVEADPNQMDLMDAIAEHVTTEEAIQN